MKIITWNINGFRSLMSRSFLEAVAQLDGDVYCLQETKLQEDEGGVDLPGFQQYWNYADRKGYAGTAVFTMQQPQGAYSGIGLEPFDSEGRAITLDFGSFYLVNCYAPHVAPDLSRLDERTVWDTALLDYLRSLDAEKPVVLCGDLNAAYNDADLNGEGERYPGVPIRRGSRGAVVRSAQARLNALGARLNADGNFGAATETAVKVFQAANGLTADGVIGRSTWNRLYGVT